MIFQLSLSDSLYLINIALIFLTLIGNIFIVIAGAFNLKREEKVNSSIFFLIIGAVEIMNVFLNWQLYDIAHMIFEDLPALIYIIGAIIPFIISINTFGVLLIILGKQNIEKYGKFLIVSGILWLVYITVRLSLFISSLSLLFLFINGLILMIMVIFIPILLIVSRIFLLLYSFKIKERILLTASIFLLNGSIVSLFYVIFHISYFFFI
ncbi:MAG: hypothetical protein P8Y23_05985 [Candidatus Lokiarchaeota archaeon]